MERLRRRYRFWPCLCAVSSAVHLKGFDMETRYTKETGVTVKHVPKIGWAHFDADNRKVGPWYQTKIELLTDHEAYLIRAGWMKQTGV